MSDELKDKVRAQFGPASDAYATSDAHAQGESLDILVDLVQPQPTWNAIDIATGAGHTAMAFAPLVNSVIATDLTEQMLSKTAELAAARGLSNLETRFADAESLPFEANSFDLLTCRLAFHHFGNPHQVLDEFARVLKPGGIMGFTDNITVADRSAADYYNAYEKLRDPSHNWIYPLVRLQVMFERAGLQLVATRELSKEFEFHKWADRQNVSEANKQKLLDMMRNIPAELQPLFQPRWADGTMYFSLWEAVIIARRAA